MLNIPCDFLCLFNKSLGVGQILKIKKNNVGLWIVFQGHQEIVLSNIGFVPHGDEFGETYILFVSILQSCHTQSTTL